MDIMSNQLIIAQIPLDLTALAIADQYQEGTSLYIPLDLSSYDTSAINYYLCEENGIELTTDIQADFNYYLALSMIADIPVIELICTYAEYGTAFPVSIDADEKQKLLLSLLQYNVLVGGAC